MIAVNKVYIVYSRNIYFDKIIESVWSSAALAEAAILVYENMYPDLRGKLNITEREVNTMRQR